MPTALPVIESGLLSSSGLVQSSDSGGDRIPIVDHFAIEPQHAPALKDGGIVFFTVVMKTGSSGVPAVGIGPAFHFYRQPIG